jgi:hypothetical protein
MIPRLSRDHEVRKLITNALNFSSPQRSAFRRRDAVLRSLSLAAPVQWQAAIRTDLNHLPGDVAVAMMPARLRGRPCENFALF